MKKSFAMLFAVCLAGVTLGAQEPERFFQAFVAGGDGQIDFMRTPLSARTIKGAPYSAETINESTQTLGDGNRISRRTTGRVYRDGQGRVRREEDRADGSQSVSIIDPVAGEAYSLNTRTRVAVKTPSAVGFAVMNKLAGGTVATFDGAMPERFDVKVKAMTEAMTEAMSAAMAKVSGSRRETRGVPEQHATETLAPRTLEGVRAEGTRTTTTIPADAIGNDLPIVITSEEWTSPELQTLVLTRHNDPRSGETTYRLTNIVRAEPDASLFQVPSDYAMKATGIRQERREQ
jgi:hypothetical protein